MKAVERKTAFLFLLVNLSTLLRTSGCEDRTPSVIIVGAGAAGVAAATRLLEGNVSDVVLLEAEDRLGGRVNSVRFGEAVVDLGAEWCHGEKGNVVFEMVKDLNVLSLRDYSDRFRAHYSNGARIRPELNMKLYGIIDRIYYPSGNKQQDEGINLGEYCLREYNKMTSNLNISDPIERNFVEDYKDFFERYTLSSEGAFSWSEPSAESDYRDCEGRLDWNWNGRGYGTIFDVLMRKFPDDSNPLPIEEKILYGKEVAKIHWDNANDTVSVSCRDGSFYNADVLVFTPSLGVLKEQHEGLFEPSLPEYKKQAIRDLGIGAVMKVMLMFEETWWPLDSDFNGFTFVWAAEDKNGKLKRYSLNGKPWVIDMMGAIPVEKNPKVLSAWFTGSKVPEIEKLSDEELIDGIHFTLSRFLSSEYNVSKPISHIRSRWYTNSHFRGTYSYQTIASRQTKSNVDMSRPLLNRNGKESVLFAGEVTNPIHYSTVHGAIETGFREANKIISKSNIV